MVGHVCVGDGTMQQAVDKPIVHVALLARGGKLSGDAAPALVPVEIRPTASPISNDAPQPVSSPPAQRARAGIIEIELGGGIACALTRDVDTETLQQVLELLRRR